MRQNRSRMPPLSVVAGYIKHVLLWGSTWAAIKVGVTSVPPFVFAFELAAAAFAGVVNTGTSWAIIFWSEQYVPSGLVAVFGAAGPVWTAFLAHFFVHDDRLSSLKIGGLLLGVLGIAVLVGAPDPGSRPEAFIATLLLALMPISWAFGT